MAMIRRQLLSNRYNPCRGVIDHLKLHPCNFIRTQTLISTPSSESPPPQTTPSTEIRPFSVDNLSNDLKVVHYLPLLPIAGASQVIIRSDLEFELDITNIEIKKVVAPVIVDLSGQFLDVTMYKIVFPKEDVGLTYGPFHLRSLPMFFFCKRGEKVAEVIGPDVVALGDTFMRLYGSLTQNISIDLAIDLKDKGTKSLVFFFTAPAADTCTDTNSSVVGELIEQYPNVLGFKIDASKIRQCSKRLPPFKEDFDCAMIAFCVRAVPAVVFIKDAKWVSYVAGVNVALLKRTFETVYGERPTKEEEEEVVRPKVDVHAPSASS